MLRVPVAEPQGMIPVTVLRTVRRSLYRSRPEVSCSVISGSTAGGQALLKSQDVPGHAVIMNTESGQAPGLCLITCLLFMIQEHTGLSGHRIALPGLYRSA